jgi:UDP-N-acetylmuramyl tripeptide synthase
VQGLHQRSNVTVEPDRAVAIADTLRQAQAGDVVLVAGKGHENYQDIQGVRSHFSDRAEAEKALARRRLVKESGA